MNSGVVANIPDRNIVVSNYVLFRKGMKSFISTAMG